MKTIKILAFVLLITGFAFAQTKHADRLYEQWKYYKAAELYRKAAQKRPTQDVYYKLGLCYQKMHKYSEAAQAYSKVDSMGPYHRDVSFYLNYGLVLKANNRYVAAKKAFKTYHEMTPDDNRGIFYFNSCDTIINDIPYNLPIRITAVSSLNSGASDLCPVLCKDGVVFVSSRQATGHTKKYDWDNENYLDIFCAKKGKNDISFGKVAPIDSGLINAKYHNGPVTFSKKGDTIYFNRVSKELKGKAKRTLQIERNKIYYAVLKNGKWDDLKPFQYNNDTFSVSTPCLANNGARIYFSSDMPGGYGGYDIYYCDKKGNGWSKPVNMGSKVNTFGDEKFPSVDSTGNFYFSSTGYMGYGGMDICVSKNIKGGYQQARVLKEPFNSGGDDYGITFMKTGKIGYFSSTRSGGGDEHIYYFNLDKDGLPCKVVTADYVIGFKCSPHKEMVEADTARKNIIKKYRIAIENAMARVHFDLDKYNIRPDAALILDTVASYIRKLPGMIAVVNGYCDCRGPYDYNMALSLNRSKSVIDYLASKGIDKRIMTPKGYGKTHYLNQCADGVICPDFEHQQNRRVEIILSPNHDNKVATAK